MSRADKTTFKNKQLEYFSDFDVNFARNPVTGNLAKVVNEDAIKQSLKMLILTSLTERPYDQLLGSKVKTTLFDLNTNFDLEPTLEVTIRSACQNEPRAKLEKLKLGYDSDRNAVGISIWFSCLNMPNQIFTLNLVVKNIR